MQKEGDFGAWESFTEKSGEEHELVVMHPDRVARLLVPYGRVAEPLVCRHLGRPIPESGNQTRRKVVEQRPQRLLSASFVEVPGHFRRQFHGDQALLSGSFLDNMTPFWIFYPSRFSDPPDPNTLAAFQNWVHGGGEPAGTELGLHPVEVLCSLTGRRLEMTIRRRAEPPASRAFTAMLSLINFVIRIL